MERSDEYVLHNGFSSAGIRAPAIIIIIILRIISTDYQTCKARGEGPYIY